MHKLPLTKTSWRAKATRQLVHTDTWGSTRNLNLGGERYILLLVDDYTRMMLLYFLGQISQIFSYFLQFKALTDKQSGQSKNFKIRLWETI